MVVRRSSSESRSRVISSAGASITATTSFTTFLSSMTVTSSIALLSSESTAIPAVEVAS